MTAIAAVTATRPTRLERSSVFLLWEVGSCSNTMSELGRIIYVYAVSMAGRDNAGGGGGIMIPPRVAMDR